jgi:flagella basal body P-ring formation protein FlgA
MKTKAISAIAILFLLASANAKADPVENDSVLRIYLPREITIDSNAPNLGQIGVIRGEEGLALKAAGVSLGEISLPGQKLVIDKHLILSRLACSGIPSSKIALSGAEEVLIRRQHQVIKGNEFVESALEFAKKNHPDNSVCEFTLVRLPEDLALPGLGRNVNLVPCFARDGAKGRAKVRVAILSGGKEIGMREVFFRLKYNCRRAVAVVDIGAGEVIGPDNVKIERSVSDYPEPSDWVLPYGLVARHKLSANTEIRPDMVGPLQPPVILKRNQNVVIKIDRFGLLVTAAGKTVQEGKVGEYIKVRNVDSQRMILAKVNEDGTVEPVF